MLTTKDYFQKEAVKNKFNELMGKNSTAFITSVMQLVSSNKDLQNCEPQDIYNCAVMAAVLNLPLNNNLGFAYVVPFNDRRNNKVVPQFQLGYKGIIQLALRSGVLTDINAITVYEGQLKRFDPLRGCEFDWDAKTSDKPVGYVGYFRLSNGFEKQLFVKRDDILKHGAKYSKTYKYDSSLWKTDEEKMAQKTVLKMLSKFMPLSTEMQMAIQVDQTYIKDAENMSFEYPDSKPIEIKPTLDPKQEFYINQIENANTKEELEKLPDEAKQIDLFNEKYSQL